MEEEVTETEEIKTTLEEAEEQVGEATDPDTQEIALGIWEQAETFLEGLYRPWNAYQVAIALMLLALALLLARIFKPRLHEWMRDRDG